MSVPATQHQQQTATASTAEEEALKRNTDCVYFLASPLTCKKGRECEYRHSEYARINPRDCYYWLNGNCLNPKCGFRHPPLDGLLGNQGGAPAGHAQAPHFAGKQAAPCVFFQKGMCMKGERCAFLHAEAAPAADPQPSKKPFVKAAEEKRFPPANFSKAFQSHGDSGAAPKVTAAGLGDGRSVERYAPQHAGGYEAASQKKAVGAPLFSDGGLSHGSDVNNSFRKPDDVLRESSPGFDVGEDFDVLVDNELRDSEYYHGEDQYGRRAQDGRNSVNEYDCDFSAVDDGEAEAFRDHRGFDPYDPMQDRQYAWGHHRRSSERGDHLERRAYLTESDLRNRLSKHRRVNGLRSVVNRDYAPDCSEGGFVDSRRDSVQESSISSRLQGRIKLPGRVEEEDGDAQFDRGQWGRNRSQLSHGRQGRFRDRIKGSRLEESHSIDQERGACMPWMRRREMEDDRNSEFPAPKRLAELKSGKEESKAEPSSIRKRKSLEDHLHRDSFMAPLPFSEILERKRVAASGGSGGGDDEKDGKIQETKQEGPDAATAMEEVGAEAKPAAQDKAEVHHQQSVETKEADKGEKDEGTMADEEQGCDGDDQNGEYYYEEGYEEDGEYYEEGENPEGEYEEVGEEGEGGDDEYAKKMGVMY